MSTPRKRLPVELIIIAALLLAAIGAGLWFFLGRTPGAWAVVRVEGREVARYSLSQNGVYPLNGGTNVLTVEDGSAAVTEADCPDKICVEQGHVRYTGQCITCLPNKLTVTIEGGDAPEVDLVS